MAHSLLSQARDADQLLKVFYLYGSDGRAISASALRASFGGHVSRVAAALRHLLNRGIISRAGGDLLSSERTYRLARPVASVLAETAAAA